jgi:cyanophycinase
MKNYSFSLSPLFTILLFAVFVPSTTLAATKSAYSYYSVGSTADKVTQTFAGVALMGGGSDVDAAFRFLIDKSGGGDIVVLCVGCNSAYNKYINKLGKVDSVETISFKSRDASSDPFVVAKIRNAEALFIAGGDQSNYLKFWKGTPVEDEINSLAQRNVPIGGTSAGLAILGEFSYTAMNSSVLSSEALADPYTSGVTLENNFLSLPLMQNIITDSHFVARDRMGRLVAFLGRIAKDGWSSYPRGIGVDEFGAVLVDADGSARFVGAGAAYFLNTPGLPQVCVADTPLTYENLSVYRITGPATFNLLSWTGLGGTAYTLSANGGILGTTQPGGGIY